ncbi:MAG: amino acid carrier protein, partial [Clostridia bacterium]|nr:amino acid carrier protein [Clostridia bacterium]
MTKVAEINRVINDFVWVRIGLILLLGGGLLMTVCTGVFQVTHIGHWFKHTLISVFRKDSGVTKTDDKNTITQFQSLCTALAATIGTGNIAGVSAAIVLGGAGAVFWMWVAAFLGMMTKFSENVLGIYFRRRNNQGEWSGGPMYFLKDGLGKKKGMKIPGAVLAVLFAIFTILASFGIGNMGQVNKIVLNIKSAFFAGVQDPQIGGMSVIALAIGAVLLVITALIVIGGLQRIAAVAEKVVPLMAIMYVVGSLVVFFVNIDKVGAMFSVIFRCAFDFKSVAAAGTGLLIKEAITQGCKRGVFSNEAGLGSAVLAHSSSNVKEPVRQGMWGIFEVFVDSFVVCTMTAIVVLSSGYIDLSTGYVAAGATVDDATL